MEKKLICPEFEGCKVGGCVHRAPHTERYSCRRPGFMCPAKCAASPDGEAATEGGGDER